MSSTGAAACAIPISARARCSAPTKARAAQNALEHGLRAQKYVVLPDEDAAEFAALKAALTDELAPQGALQSVLAGRIARAAWRLARADRIEAEILGVEPIPGGDLGLALIWDCNGARALPTLLRYRGAALAELMRSLRVLEALQAEARAAAGAEAPAPALRAQPVQAKDPIEPETCRHPGGSRHAAAGPPSISRARPARSWQGAGAPRV